MVPRPLLPIVKRGARRGHPQTADRLPHNSAAVERIEEEVRTYLYGWSPSTAERVLRVRPGAAQQGRRER